MNIVVSTSIIDNILFFISASLFCITIFCFGFIRRHILILNLRLQILRSGNVVIDSADFYTLADQLDRFKVQAVKQLEVMHTYLTHSGGDVAMTSKDLSGH